MYRKIFVLSLALAVLFVLKAVPSFEVYAQSVDKGLYPVLEHTVDDALLAYNQENYPRFSKNFAKAVSSMVTKHYFDSVFVYFYKKSFGSIRTKMLRDKESLFDKSFPCLVYDAVFDKCGEGVITVDFMLENDFY